MSWEEKPNRFNMWPFSSFNRRKLISRSEFTLYEDTWLTYVILAYIINVLYIVYKNLCELHW